MIVLDASVMISAFRRHDSREVSGDAIELARLIDDDAPLAVPGIACQEVLAGARTAMHFDRLRQLLAGFPVLLADQSVHHQAARVAAMCRGSGIAATAVDCLVAAHALAAGGWLFTLDRDFEPIARRCGLRLHPWR